MSLISLYCTFLHFFSAIKLKVGKETVKFLAFFDHPSNKLRHARVQLSLVLVLALGPGQRPCGLLDFGGSFKNTFAPYG